MVTPEKIHVYHFSPASLYPELLIAQLETPDLFSVQAQLPSGVYTTFRTYQKNRFFRLGEHFKRLEESARLLGSTVGLDDQRIRSAIRWVLEQTPYGETRIRLSLDLTRNPGDLYLVTEPLVLLSETAYQHGVRAVTERMQRETPKAKSTAFTLQAEDVRRRRINGANEVLMVAPSGEILEGLSSNFFATCAGKVYTAEKGVLSGITRGLVLEIIAENQVPVVSQGVQLEDLPEIEEAFVTSVSRGILPVVNIDRRDVGSGAPGPLTRQLMAQFDQRIRAAVEPA